MPKPAESIPPLDRRTRPRLRRTREWGRLRGGRPGGGRPLAIAVNGRIAAVGRTFSLAGSHAENFAVIVPEWTLRPGENDVRAFEIVPRYGRPALRPL